MSDNITQEQVLKSAFYSGSKQVSENVRSRLLRRINRWFFKEIREITTHDESVQVEEFEQLLQEFDVDVDYLVCDCGTLLHYLAELANCAALITWLIEVKNLDPRAINKKGKTPLWYAVKYGKLANVKALIGYYDAEYLNRMCNRHDDTLLHITLYSYWRENNGFTLMASEMIAVLLEAGMNPNLQGYCGATVLHYVVKDMKRDADDMEVAKLLVHYGAVMSIKNHSGDTVYDIAKENGHESEVITLLQWKQKMVRQRLLKESIRHFMETRAQKEEPIAQVEEPAKLL